MPYTPLGPYITGMEWDHLSQGSDCANYPGPYLRGSSERYLVSEHSTGEADGLLDVFRSPDLGVTWAPQDVSNMPSTFNTGVCTSRVNADTIRVCYSLPGATYPVVNVRDFDMVTNTLGTVLYDLSSFHLLWSITKPIYQRSSVAAEDRIFASAISGGLVGYVLALFRHDGSGFLPIITIDAGGVYPDDYNISPEALFMDPAGTSHVIYSKLGIFHSGVPQPNYGVRYFYYVQVNAAGAATAPVLVLTYPIGTTAGFGFPALLGNKLAFPFGTQHGTTIVDQYFTGSILVMDPYTSPIPTISQVDLPTEQVANYSLPTPIETPAINATTLGSLMYLWWIDVQGLDGVTPLSRIMYATWDGTTIGAPILFYDNIATPLIPTPYPLMGMAPTYMDVADPMIAVNGHYFYTGNVPPPPPVIPSRPRIFGNRRMVILEPNAFDTCLSKERRLARQMDWHQQICCVPDKFDMNRLSRFPADAEEFRIIKAVPTPLASAGDVLVATYLPPLGFDGILHGIFHQYTGPGFRDGGGDIEWRIQFGPAYGKGFGNILVQMGKVEKFYSLGDGIPLLSHRPLKYFVYVPNGSGGILPVNSQIVCGLQGWIFPRK